MERDPDEEQARRRRATVRAGIVTLRRVAFGADESGAVAVRGEAALLLAVELTRAAWSLGGRPWPRYARAETPYAFVPRVATTA